MLQSISESITVVLYVADLFFDIHDPPSAAARITLLAKTGLDIFSDTTGLTVNLPKSALLLKGSWTPDLHTSLHTTKISVKDRFKCLGVLMGHISSEAAYDPALQKALGRAFSMQHWNLSLSERVKFIKLWILPVLAYPPRVLDLHVTHDIQWALPPLCTAAG